ncbi:MAG: haloacid dehalogenase-like hydrolase [Micromonosporaceae bacterium]|nr:haloacid dehalogenase-like hydrolase [Micromonosporaceae bacterium]
MWDVDQTLTVTRPLGGESFIAAFTALTGRSPDDPPNFAGGTDRHSCAWALSQCGITDPEPYFDRFFELMAAEFAARAHRVIEVGRVLPGAAEVLAGLAVLPHITQTLVTGNIPPVARAKIAPFGLDAFVDLEVGGYGWDHEVRAHLVRLCVQRAGRKYGHDFDELVVVGDTPRDVEAGLAHGATVVGVATGFTRADDLKAAGAHVVLESLADVPAAVELLAG